MSASNAKAKGRKTYKNPRQAKMHWNYSRPDVMSMYDVSTNTISNWIANGLRVIKGKDLLFRGSDLNAFHRYRRDNAKRPCDWHEVYCFCCKQRHSLLVLDYQIATTRNYGIRITFTCPETEKTGRKLLGQEAFERMEKTPKTKTSSDNGDYNAVHVPTEIGNLAYRPMNTHNERLIYRLQKYFFDIRQRDLKTIDAMLAHIRRFETFASYHRLTDTTIEDAIAFRRALADRSGKPLSASSIVHILASLREAFRWLKDQPEGANIMSDVIECLKAPKAFENAARLPVEKLVLKVDQIRKVILAMPVDTIWQRRDRAILAFLLLSGMRVTAILKLRLRHIDTVEGRIKQDPTEIDIKGDKAMWTSYFPVGSDIAEIFREWISEVEANAANDGAYIFPKTPNQRRRASASIFLEHWATADPIRKIIKTAASAVDVPILIRIAFVHR